MPIPITQILSPNYTPGRCGSGSILAVVLHEYDGSIEQLDSFHNKCQSVLNPICHGSFHYGISDCVAHQYVLNSDTAWSFLPTDPTCNVDPAWTIPPTQVGVNPNCYTINVAVATGYNNNDPNACFPNTNFYSPELYRCLADLLCQIFLQINITPSATTLVRHLPTELADLNMALLLANVLNCYNNPIVVPPNPVLCSQLGNLPNGGTATSSTRVIGADCRAYFLPSGVGVQTPITPIDTNTVNLTASGVDNHTLQADVIISPDANNQLSALPNGLFVPPHNEVPNTVVDTTTIDFSATGVLNRTISGNVRVSSAINNQLTVVGDGLFVPPTVNTPITGVDTPSVDLTISGIDNHTVRADVIISPNPNNQLFSLPNGLFVSPTPNTPVTGLDSPTVNLTVSGFDDHTILAEVNVSNVVGNSLTVQPDGLYVPPIVETPLTVVDTPTINFTTSGVSNHTLTGEVLISKDQCNALRVVPDGMYVPNSEGIRTHVINQTIFRTIDRVNLVTNDATIRIVPPLPCEPQDLWVVNVFRNNTVRIVSSGGEPIGNDTQLVLTSPHYMAPLQGMSVHLVWSDVYNGWYAL